MTDRKTPPFPVFLDLAGATVLVVGSNDIAARRAEAVLRSGAHVRLAAETLARPVAHLADDERVTWLGRDFQPDDISGCRLVMVATDDDAFNHVVSGLAHGAGVPVNVADSLRLCSFIMPAIVDRAPITIAMSSGGAAPVLARRVKTAIEQTVPANIGTLAAYAGSVRARVNAEITSPKRRREFWQHLADGTIAGHVLAGRMAEADAQVAQNIADLARDRDVTERGEVIVIGAGSGDPDLLSLRALRLIQRGDIIVHDPGVAAAILDLARKDAERLAMAEREEACMKVCELASDGHNVLWICDGEPAEFDCTDIIATRVAAASAG